MPPKKGNSYCLICSKPSQHVFSIGEYKIYECTHCAHRMSLPEDHDRHVTTAHSDKYHFRGARDYPDYIQEKDLLTQRGRWYSRIISKFIKKPGKVLDVGSAVGFILKGFVDCGWEGHGIEPNDRLASHARRELGLRVYTGSIESFKTEEKYDLVCFLQVIAHLIDPRRALKVAYGLIASPGYILVETWNWKSLTAKFFGRLWHEYSPPNVFHWFSPKSLNQLMSDFNLELIASGHPQKRVSGHYAKSLIVYKTKNLPLAPAVQMCFKLMPDNMTIPYPSEDLFWSLFKKR